MALTPDQRARYQRNLLIPGIGEAGQERLAALLVEMRERTAMEIVEAVNKALRDWCVSDVAEDDVTLVVARRTAPPGKPVSSSV